MSSKNTTYKYFIGFADLNGAGKVEVEHYDAVDDFDCISQCLWAHNIYIHDNIKTVEELFELAKHKNCLVSKPERIIMMDIETQENSIDATMRKIADKREKTEIEISNATIRSILGNDYDEFNRDN